MCVRQYFYCKGCGNANLIFCKYPVYIIDSDKESYNWIYCVPKVDLRHFAFYFASRIKYNYLYH